MLQNMGVLVLSAIGLIFASGLAWLVVVRLRERRTVP